MHSIPALQQGCQRSIWEVVLHLEQMNQFWHFSALLHYLFGVLTRICNELFNGLLVSEDAVLVVIFENTEIGFTGHQQPVFHDVYQAETEEVQRNVHEVRCTVGHQSNNVISNDLTVHSLGDMLEVHPSRHRHSVSFGMSAEPHTKDRLRRGG